MDILPVIAIAFAISIVFSMLGLGGAIIYTPFFFWLGIPLLSAIPMALFLNMITTASASITYSRQELVHKKMALPIIILSAAGAFIGSYFASRIDYSLIIILLSIVILAAAIRLFFFNNLGLMIKGEKKSFLSGGFLAFFFGMISSLIGIGGGTFIVPLLLILGLEMKNAAATSAYIITFTSLSGFLGHMVFSAQPINPGLLLYAAIAAFIGAQVGSKIIFKRISSNIISKLFALVLLFISIKLLYGFF